MRSRRESFREFWPYYLNEHRSRGCRILHYCGTISGLTTAGVAGQIEHTNANVFSADETADVGIDEGTSVSDDYQDGKNQFTGTIGKVTVELK